MKKVIKNVVLKIRINSYIVTISVCLQNLKQFNHKPLDQKVLKDQEKQSVSKLGSG